jgi:hypothetical protein
MGFILSFIEGLSMTYKSQGLTFKNAFPFNEIIPLRLRIDESSRSLAGSVNEAVVAMLCSYVYYLSFGLIIQKEKNRSTKS